MEYITFSRQFALFQNIAHKLCFSGSNQFICCINHNTLISHIQISARSYGDVRNSYKCSFSNTFWYALLFSFFKKLSFTVYIFIFFPLSIKMVKKAVWWLRACVINHWSWMSVPDVAVNHTQRDLLSICTDFCAVSWSSRSVKIQFCGVI